MPNAGVSTPSLPGVPGQVPAAQLLRSASPAAWLPASQKQLCPKRALKSLPASPAACQPTCRPIYVPGMLRICCMSYILLCAGNVCLSEAARIMLLLYGVVAAACFMLWAACCIHFCVLSLLYAMVVVCCMMCAGCVCCGC